MTKLVVMKFGGTSVGSAARIHEVARIVREASSTTSIVVVASAMSGTTDLLVTAAKAAANKDQAVLDEAVSAIRERHQDCIAELGLAKRQQQALHNEVNELLDDLSSLLDSIFALGELSNRASDLVVSFGERLNIRQMAAALEHAGTSAKAIEASKLIITNDRFGDAQPQLEASAAQAMPVLMPLVEHGIVPVVTGFIGATESGITTTLGRGGSDYSATILGYCLAADEVWIWTDVDGVMTADPRLIPQAKNVPTLSYDEAAELSYFGAKVLHPLTMVPAALKDIPIYIKNTFNPASVGTKISRQVHHAKNASKAITSMKDLSLITVQGKGMSGVPGVAAKVFTAIANEQINVLFISQASSEYNISLVVRRADGKHAHRILQRAFDEELSEHSIETVKVEDGLAIVAVVGEGLRRHPGVAGTVFASLGAADVNVAAIAQGSSERNISLVIAESDVPQAVHSIHDAFQLGNKEEAS